MEIMRQARGQI
jgi:hypothetical protein